MQLITHIIGGSVSKYYVNRGYLHVTELIFAVLVLVNIYVLIGIV